MAPRILCFFLFTEFPLWEIEMVSQNHPFVPVQKFISFLFQQLWAFIKKIWFFLIYSPTIPSFASWIGRWKNVIKNIYFFTSPNLYGQTHSKSLWTTLSIQKNSNLCQHISTRCWIISQTSLHDLQLLWNGGQGSHLPPRQTLPSPFPNPNQVKTTTASTKPFWSGKSKNGKQWWEISG